MGSLQPDMVLEQPRVLHLDLKAARRRLCSSGNQVEGLCHIGQTGAAIQGPKALPP